jgi:hypothetical protein
MRTVASTTPASPFNGPVEIGLRALFVLAAAYPSVYSLQHLVLFDYLIVHSDDLPGGPQGLHPQTPHRSGELFVRREVLQSGLALYESRGLVERTYRSGGIFFGATDTSAGFLDSLLTEYVAGLRHRADWLIGGYGLLEEAELNGIIRERVGAWGAEFTMESVLREEEAS